MQTATRKLLPKCRSYLLVLAALLVFPVPRTEAQAAPARAESASSAAIDRRVEALLARMTLEEKAGQLTQFAFGVFTGPGDQRLDEEKIRRGEVGSLLGLIGSGPTNRLQHIAVERSRLHIPLLFGLDVIHGERTIFPVPLALAASFDPELVTATSHVAAAEARADGIRWVFSPMVDIARDARWGRIVESAGESPFLGSTLARAYVHGYQGSSLGDPASVAACVKHFAAYGASLAGRDYNTVDMSETQLRQVYLAPYRAAVEAGVATVMTSFSTLNGVPATANQPLLTGILRKDWGFHGVVVSDWGAVGELVPHGVAATGRDATSLALGAGTDIDMQSGDYEQFLPALVREGEISTATLDAAVRRVLRLKFELGLFDHPYTPVSSGPGQTSVASRALALRAAEESFVLLKNDTSPIPEHTATGAAEPLYGSPKHPLLPLDPAAHQTVALIGPLADSKAEMLGSWAAAGAESDVHTLRESLGSRLHQRLLFARGTEIRTSSRAGFAAAIQAARAADVVILALGEDGPTMTGEGSSRTRLDLPGNQEALLESVAAVGKRVVLVLFSGRPLAIPWAAIHVPAILEAWFPGMEAGPALAATLFGESVPSGRLPAEFPYDVGQESLFLAQLPTGRPVAGVDLSRAPRNGDEKSHSRYIDEYNEPVFPFGWGLSYTRFEYGSPKVLPAAETGVQISVPVTNTGGRAAAEVVQLYTRRLVAPVAQPVRELKGFQRIVLQPGETKTVRFDLQQQDLGFFIGDRWIAGADGQIDVWVGGSSAASERITLFSRGGVLQAGKLPPGGR